jgi:hypothetical protein
MRLVIDGRGRRQLLPRLQMWDSLGGTLLVPQQAVYRRRAPACGSRCQHLLLGRNITQRVDVRSGAPKAGRQASLATVHVHAEFA